MNMINYRSIGDVIQKIAQDHGEQALLDSKFVLAVFMDLAPQLKKEKELLRSFLACSGAEKLVRVKTASPQDQEACIYSLVKDLEENQWLSKQAAQYVCSEFYRGLTGRNWTFGSPIAAELEVHKETVTSTDQPPRKPWVLIATAVIAVVLAAVLIIFPGKTTPPVEENQDSTALPSQVPATTHTHSWQNATCSTPQTCTTCGETTGQATGHQWLDATYDHPRTCSACGETEGSTLGYPLVWCPILERASSEEDVGIGTWTDTFGNAYTEAIRFWVVDRPNWYDTEQIVFDLDHNYRSLSCTFSCGTESDPGASVRILIYGDGQLIYESATVYTDTQPLAFSVDVSGIEQLVVACTTDSEAFSYGIAQIYMYR